MCLPIPILLLATTPGLHGSDVRAADLAPGGRLLVEAHGNGRVFLRDLEGETSRELQPSFPAPCWAAAFDLAGERIAVLDHRAHLTVWDLKGGEPRTAWSDVVVEEVTREDPYSLSFPGGVRLAWSAGGEFLAAEVHGGRRAVWDREGRLLRSWRSKRAAAELEWLGAELLVPAGTTITAWRPAFGGVELVRSLEVDDEIEALAVSPDGGAIWTGHEGGRLCRRDPATGSVQGVHVLPDIFADDDENDWVASIAVSPSGKRVAYSLAPSVHVRVLDVETLELLHDSDFLTAHFGETMPVTWSPDSAWVYAAFPCSKSPLFAFSEEHPEGRQVLQDAVLPRFRGELGVVIAGRRVNLIDAAGNLAR